MRRPPPPHPRGVPRTPGSGRKKGTANRKTIELRALMGALVGNVDYQHRLRADFQRRRVHPSVETLVWNYAIGRPAERVQLSADVRTNQKLDAERELLLRLSVEQLEALAAESQALVDKAMAMARNSGVMQAPATAARTPLEHGAKNDTVGRMYTGTDVAALPVGVSGSSGAGTKPQAVVRKSMEVVHASGARPDAATAQGAAGADKNNAEPADKSTDVDES